MLKQDSSPKSSRWLFLFAFGVVFASFSPTNLMHLLVVSMMAWPFFFFTLFLPNQSDGELIRFFSLWISAARHPAAVINIYALRQIW
mmetsp:Transcript_17991/g.35168  ORF Transcript_17991/g.35168 Transcript_17991/m.35168 type:complete len:87 (+) Transcript_17991:81-341(+)